MTKRYPRQAPRAAVKLWLADPLSSEIAERIERLRKLKDALHLAVMPDVHLAPDVCVGVAIATSNLLYPAAVGGDIGCGMAAIAFEATADCLADESVACSLLDRLNEAVPISRRHVPFDDPWLSGASLSDPGLNRYRDRDGRVQLGTLGRGNHFVEFQADEEDNRLWLMVHTGSRGMGQAIRAFHENQAERGSRQLKYLDGRTEAGRAYLHDVGWARAYAERNRRAIIASVAAFMHEMIGVNVIPSSRIGCDHNHVKREYHFGQWVWVHRKGVAPAGAGQVGLIPGSMGTASFHVNGRGCVEALKSSSHGAGRVLTRTQARRRFRTQALESQLEGVWYDARQWHQLAEEAPRAYRDIHAVMRAQRKLVKPIRRLRPILSYKG